MFCFVLYGTNFLFPLNLIIFVGDKDKMMMDYVSHFLRRLESGALWRKKECSCVTCLLELSG